MPSIPVKSTTISELASVFGVSTLRFYEAKGFLTPERIGNTRLYTTKDRIRLELILKGKKLGFTLDEIWTLISTRPSELQSPDVGSIVVVHLNIAEVEKQLSILERRKEDLEIAISELRIDLDLRHAEGTQDSVFCSSRNAD